MKEGLYIAFDSETYFEKGKYSVSGKNGLTMRQYTDDKRFDCYLVSFAIRSEDAERFGVEELSQAMNETLTAKWAKLRGLEVVSVAMNSITLPDEDAEMIKQAQRTAIMRDPTMAAATIVGAQADAMKAAAENKNGAMMGFMGMGMAQQAGGMNAQNLFAMGQQQQQAAAAAAPAAPAANTWKCACGVENTGKFCRECGKPKPAPAASWKCACGTENTGKFCLECGKPKPVAAAGWTCACGTVNKGKFCMECGKPKPANEPLYRCDKCGDIVSSRCRSVSAACAAAGSEVNALGEVDNGTS